MLDHVHACGVFLCQQSAPLRQTDFSVRFFGQQPPLGQNAQHPGYRGLGDAHAPGYFHGRHAGMAAHQFVYSQQISQIGLGDVHPILLPV